jgi:hypothetical protein
MSVLMIAAMPLAPNRWARAVASVLLASSQPRMATLPSLASMPTTI